jgi:2-C-methyl-D-erythritol 2,4-cyclodiphosphate synthase
MRIGTGWDRHKLVAGRKCILGGIHFSESDVGPLGHSDGDVVIHAVIDALLGAAAAGDIGTLFPDTDPQWEGVDSRELLTIALKKIADRGFSPANVDLTVIAELPRIQPRAAEMVAVLAEALGLNTDHVSIKATRGEGLGPEGRGECVTVNAVALLSESGES